MVPFVFCYHSQWYESNRCKQIKVYIFHLFWVFLFVIVFNTNDVPSIDYNISPIEWNSIIAKFTMKLFLLEWCIHRFEKATVMNGIEFIGFNYQHYFSIFDRTNKWIYQNKNCDFLSKTAVISSIRAIQQNEVLFLSTTCEQSSVNCFISLDPIGFYQLFLPHLHWHCTECEMCDKLYWHRTEMKWNV